METKRFDEDVIIVGGGISGLAAANRLKQLQITSMVLEKDSRVGGRMTTDRVQGFSIDRGVTILSEAFKNMLEIVDEYKLHGKVNQAKFSFAFQANSYANKRQLFRAGRFDDILFNKSIGLKAKMATIKFGLKVLLNRKQLYHGMSDKAIYMDDMSCEQYLKQIKGDQLIDQLFMPGLNGPMGGVFRSNSRLILLQTFWNILMNKVWTLGDGVDCIPEVLAKNNKVIKNAVVQKVNYYQHGVEVEVLINGTLEKLRSKAVIIAVPGNYVTSICELPQKAKEILNRTHYSKMVNVHIALGKKPQVKSMGFGYSDNLQTGIELELEHERAPRQCPKDQYMVSAFMWDTDKLEVTSLNDQQLTDHAHDVVMKTFPECKDSVLFTHIVRWDLAIAQFPVGRLKEITQLRKQMDNWDIPVQLCGDYLDGLSSEGALFTGKQAADRIATYLNYNN